MKIIILASLLLFSMAQQLQQVASVDFTTDGETRSLATKLLGKPYISDLSVDQISIESGQASNKNGCFGNELMKIKDGQKVYVKANKPFVLFLTTKLTKQYYNYQDSYSNLVEDMTVNSISLAHKDSSNYISNVSLHMKCNNASQYYQLTAYVHVDFYESKVQERRQFDFVVVCSTPEAIDAFLQIYTPGYVVFWLIFNFSLMTYHNYYRNNYHYLMMLVYFVGSLLLKNTFYAHLASGALFFVVILKEKKEFCLNNKSFSLYLIFMLLFIAQTLYIYDVENSSKSWNDIWIAQDSFLTMHISMFMALRLIKLRRIRHVFWYLVALSIFCTLYEGQNNKFFELRFKNLLDLTCITVNIFFPIMIIPISNYFTTLTNWMHRIFSVFIALAAILPLSLSIKMMFAALLLVILYEIKAKNLGIVRHSI